MKPLRFLFAQVCLAATLLAFTSSSSALEQFSFPFDVTVDCPTELVYLEGTGRFKTQYIENANGATTIFHAFWHARGMGLTTGAEYKLNGKWMEVIQERAPYVYRGFEHFQLVGIGAAEDFKLYWRYRFVVDPNGNIILDKLNWDWACPNA